MKISAILEAFGTGKPGWARPNPSSDSVVVKVSTPWSVEEGDQAINVLLFANVEIVESETPETAGDREPDMHRYIGDVQLTHVQIGEDVIPAKEALARWPDDFPEEDIKTSLYHELIRRPEYRGLSYSDPY